MPKPPIPEEIPFFGQRVRAIRKQRKLTQRALEQLTGLPNQSISVYETGKKYPSSIALVRLAVVFGVSMDYLVGRVEVPTQTVDSQRSDAAALIHDLANLSDDDRDLLLSFIAVLKTRRKV